jgi:hypothetical protein
MKAILCFAGSGLADALLVNAQSHRRDHGQHGSNGREIDENVRSLVKEVGRLSLCSMSSGDTGLLLGSTRGSIT